MKISTSRGFTLIELLVVIAIIGILSSVVLASLNSARQKSRDARRIADVKQLQTAFELYYDANQSYPVGGGTAAGMSADALTGVAGTYIPTIPKDPQSTTASPISYLYLSLTSTAAACTASPCPSYVLSAKLEDTAHSALTNSYKTNVGTFICATGAKYCVRP